MSVKDLIENIATEPRDRYRHRRDLQKSQWFAGRQPWYAKGLLIQHYTTGLFANRTFCGRFTLNQTSNGELRTIWPFHCRRCKRILKRINS